MISNIKICESQDNTMPLENIFKKDYKVKYKKKLSGNVKLYVSEKNALKGLSGILSLYMRELH